MGTRSDLERSERPAGRQQELLTGQIEALRGELGDLIAEMERRGRHALDVRRQVRRHPLAVAGVVLGAAAGVGLLLWLRAARRPPALTGWERLRLSAARSVVPGRMKHRELWLLDDRRLRRVPEPGRAGTVAYLPRR